MKLTPLIQRVNQSRLWSKHIWFDMVCTKWADLWPEDVWLMRDILIRLEHIPSTAKDYRLWLNGKSYE